MTAGPELFLPHYIPYFCLRYWDTPPTDDMGWWGLSASLVHSKSMKQSVELWARGNMNSRGATRTLWSSLNYQDAPEGSRLRPGGRGLRKGKQISHVKRREMFQEKYIENKNSKEAREGKLSSWRPALTTVLRNPLGACTPSTWLRFDSLHPQSLPGKLWPCLVFLLASLQSVTSHDPGVYLGFFFLSPLQRFYLMIHK